MRDLGKANTIPMTAAGGDALLTISYWQDIGHLHTFARARLIVLAGTWWAAQHKKYPQIGIMHETNVRCAEGRMGEYLSELTSCRHGRVNAIAEPCITCDECTCSPDQVSSQGVERHSSQARQYNNAGEGRRMEDDG